MKRIAIASVISIATVRVAWPADETQEKRFVMEFRQNNGQVSGVELVVAGPADEALSPIELLEKRVGD